jgi:hypothetical protein
MTPISLRRSRGSPRSLDHDVRLDSNALDGFPDRTVHQTIRGIQGHAFGLGREQTFEHIDSAWRETAELTG